MVRSFDELLQAIHRGEAGATDELLPLVYEQLRALAARELACERPGHTLQATALVHEAFLRLCGNPGGRWDGIGHFHAAAAVSMRRILVEAARARAAEKRGGGWQRVTLNGVAAPAEFDQDQLLDLDAALGELAAEDPRKARLVELRYFTGLELAECAAALGVSPATADRDWAYARAWLFDRLRRGHCPGE
ncbi:MAG: sigma-70 family RNA polymerase sigma factor [Planctomycetes bacterium]|nr:sigma-70 family RNA polymerase sigma factor [Planctomycetota bacterium]